MSAEELIRKLTGELKPVQKLEPPLSRYKKWILTVFLWMFFGVLFLGLRKDFADKITELSFAAEMSLLILTAALAGISAFILSVPGEEDKKPWVLWLPFAPLLLWTGRLLYRFLTIYLEGGKTDLILDSGMKCSVMILALGFLPGLLIFIQIRRATPLRLGWSGAFSALAAMSTGAFMIQVLCLNDQPIHLILWHLAPLPIMSSLGIFLGKRFLKWPRV